jgi:hypothetical protein
MAHVEVDSGRNGRRIPVIPVFVPLRRWLRRWAFPLLVFPFVALLLAFGGLTLGTSDNFAPQVTRAPSAGVSLSGYSGLNSVPWAALSGKSITGSAGAGLGEEGGRLVIDGDATHQNSAAGYLNSYRNQFYSTNFNDLREAGTVLDAVAANIADFKRSLEIYESQTRNQQLYQPVKQNRSAQRP